MRVMPLGKSKTQKFVCGDNSGSLSCLQVKRGESKTEWVYRLESEGRGEVPISHVELGGQADKKEHIYLSSGQTIAGVKRSGKQFFKLNTTLTETISTLFVEDVNIYAGGEYIYNLFESGADKCFYMCTDRINDLTVENISRVGSSCAWTS